MQPGKISNFARLFVRAGFSSSRAAVGSLSQVTSANASTLSCRGSDVLNGSGRSVSCYQPQPFLLGGVRFKYTKKWSNKVAQKDPEGVPYYGFTYFPRHPGQQDPPVEPAKLFLVKKIRSLYGCPFWEKKWMIDLHLDKPRSVAIIKNTPRNNARLYRVKHLVEITPITTPQGLPDSPENGFLKENGEFVAYNLLKEHGSLSLEEAEKVQEEHLKNNIDIATVRQRLHERWYSRWDVV